MPRLMRHRPTRIDQLAGSSGRLHGVERLLRLGPGLAGSGAKIVRLMLAVFAVAQLGGCAGDGPTLPKISDLNPFAEKQQPLPGRRIPVVQTTDSISTNLAEATDPIAIPSPRVNESWAQPGGEASNAPGHLALAGAPRQVWSASAGTGSSKSGRIMASPIIYQGRIYTLDSQAVLSGFNLSGGRAFQISTVPEGESGGGHGGGLAADSGRLFVANGYGVVASLDPASGKVAWQKNLGSPVRSAPTAAAGRLFVTAIDGRTYAFDANTGDELWSARGLPQPASLMNSTSPAVEGDTVIVPYPSGDVVALKIADGTPVWSESLARTRQVSQLASMSDAARPAIDGGTVFAVGHAGRMIATEIKSGERLWSVTVPGTQTPWVAGDTVFVVDTQGKLMALARRDGAVRWQMQMPESKNWVGPVLAGGTLWLVSSAGKLVGVDAATGRASSEVNLGEPVYIPPVVAQGRMFVLTDSAKLVALN
jgi:outer membrane protein assembly factor BamB